MLVIWPQRCQQRTRLRAMTAHQLDDIGLTRCQAEQESRKPFWR
ncbi:DUF1127 domain-containing protein [Magnetospirillum sp. J10]|uniref:DUF1127 domain-containing protein n=1 Tax=Magnetospirillum sulfuroxidans TaxID=611300 RepID=A0ABS5IFL3_9PROT|nr:DUF1127 domain-containing protein [Magnetospirillum sulfuroxidans]